MQRPALNYQHRMKIRFTAQADTDIVESYLYGFTQFGQRQAEQYEQTHDWP